MAGGSMLSPNMIRSTLLQKNLQALEKTPSSSFKESQCMAGGTLGLRGARPQQVAPIKSAQVRPATKPTS